MCLPDVCLPMTPGEPLRLVGVELRWLELSLAEPLDTAGGTHAARPIVLVRVVTDHGEGYGECAALAEPGYSHEYAARAWRTLEGRLVPGLLDSAGGQVPSPGEVGGILEALLDTGDDQPMARAALEMGVLDAVLRVSGRSLAEYLGVTAPVVPAGGVVGICSTPGELIEKVAAMHDRGTRRVKVKIRPGHDVEPLSALRGAFGDVELLGDANGAYRLGDHRRLARLDPLGLLCIEQPLPAHDLAGHAELARRIGTPVCLDESLRSVADLEKAIATGACEVACIKPARMGGYLAAVAASEMCLSSGVPAYCGGMLEAGLARAANAALAGLPAFTIPGDLAGGERFVEGDPFGALEDLGGVVPVWHSPGLGPCPDVASLARVTTRTSWVGR